MKTEPKGEKGKRTKAIIQDSIISLVSDEGLGISEITLERICRKSKVTVGAFYFHFVNKETAIDETAIGLIERFYQREENEAGDFKNTITAFILCRLRLFTETPKVARLILVALRNSPTVHQTYQQMQLSAARWLQGLFESGRMKAGLPHEDQFMTALFLIAGLESHCENIFTGQDDALRTRAGAIDQIADHLALLCCRSAGLPSSRW